MSLTSVNPDEPRAKMAAVISALISGARLPEAATVAGVSPAVVRRWKEDDPVFIEMLEAADERASNAIIEEGIRNVRVRIKGLGERALAVLDDALDSHDERIKLQAASKVLQIAGVAEKAAPTVKKEPGGGVSPTDRD